MACTQALQKQHAMLDLTALRCLHGLCAMHKDQDGVRQVAHRLLMAFTMFARLTRQPNSAVLPPGQT